MSQLEFKQPILWASLAGAALTSMYIYHQVMLEENNNGEFEEFKSPDQVKKELVNCLKNELKLKFKSHDIPRDKDGKFTLEFLVDIHSLIYKYKLAGHDMIGDAFFKERISILK